MVSLLGLVRPGSSAGLLSIDVVDSPDRFLWCVLLLQSMVLMCTGDRVNTPVRPSGSTAYVFPLTHAGRFSPCTFFTHAGV